MYSLLSQALDKKIEEAKNNDVEEEVIRNERETKMDFDERAAPTVVQGGESW